MQLIKALIKIFKVGCDNIKAKNIFILSQTEPWEILVGLAVAIPTRTGAKRTTHSFWLIFLCAWLSHAHVYSIQIRNQRDLINQRSLITILCYNEWEVPVQ